MGIAVDLYEDFVQVPALLQIGHFMNAAFPYLRGEHRTKPVPPEPHRLMTNVDATLGQQVLDLAQR